MIAPGVWTPPNIILPRRRILVPDRRIVPWQAAFSITVGTVVNSVGTLSPAAPTSAAGDIHLMCIEDSAEASPPTLTTAAGYALVTGGSVSVNGPGPSASAVGCSVWWRRWNGTDGNPTVADIGNHLHGVVLAIKGVITVGNPWDQVQTSTKSANSTSVSITGATASKPGTLVVAVCAASLPDLATTTEYSAVANANLTNVTERVDDTTTAGNGGGLLVVTGELATAIAWGATTATSVTSAANANVALNLIPEPPIDQIALHNYPQLLAH